MMEWWNGEWWSGGMGNGEWGMGNGEWGMGNGEWGMGNGDNTDEHGFSIKDRFAKRMWELGGINHRKHRGGSGALGRAN